MTMSCFAMVSATFGQDLVIADQGVSDYHIVVGHEASMQDYHAAEVLQSHIEQMTGAKLQIFSDNSALGANEIIIGFNRHFDVVDSGIDRRS